MSKPKKNKTIKGGAGNRVASNNIRCQSLSVPKEPSWQFHLLCKKSNFAWPADEENTKKILGILQRFETMTWDEIVGSRNHQISPDKLIKEANDELTKLNQDDIEIETLFSLHINGKERIWGIRDRNTLKLLWWDPEHKVCPSFKQGNKKQHQKKH